MTPRVCLPLAAHLTLDSPRCKCSEPCGWWRTAQPESSGGPQALASHSRATSEWTREPRARLPGRRFCPGRSEVQPTTTRGRGRSAGCPVSRLSAQPSLDSTVQLWPGLGSSYANTLVTSPPEEKLPDIWRWSARSELPFLELRTLPEGHTQQVVGGYS